MSLNDKQIFFHILRSEIKNIPISTEIKTALTEKDLDKIYELSKAHDLTHIFSEALYKNGIFNLMPTEKPKFQNASVMAWFRYERIQFTYDEICTTFENGKIDYIPLKGAVIRNYYPSPEMRTSCDIDILVKETDLSKATELLVAKLNCRNEGRGSHDIQLVSDNDIHIELHYTLIEERFSKASSRILADVWQFVKKSPNCKKQLTDEMFYFYHIAHMSKHFVEGGCGIRPFLDLYYLKNSNIDFYNKAFDLLKKAHLETFAIKCEQLTDVWINEKEYDNVLQHMEDYIIYGGIYGDYQSGAIVKQVKAGGKLRFYISKIWKPYSELVYQYPALEKKKYLLPFYQICRWSRLIFRGGAQRNVKRLGFDKDNPEKLKSISIMIKELNL